MQLRKTTFIAGLLTALYGAAVGIAADTPPAGAVAQAANATPAKEATQVKDAPAPGSPGDTLTREDARMAYLVYKLLGKDGKIKGANLKRGAKLFYQNCRPCHGEDGRRTNVNPSGTPVYIGHRAREDMPTFWYQMNFGDEDRKMEAYYVGRSQNVEETLVITDARRPGTLTISIGIVQVHVVIIDERLVGIPHRTPLRKVRALENRHTRRKMHGRCHHIICIIDADNRRVRAIDVQNRVIDRHGKTVHNSCRQNRKSGIFCHFTKQSHKRLLSNQEWISSITLIYPFYMAFFLENAWFSWIFYQQVSFRLQIVMNTSQRFVFFHNTISQHPGIFHLYFG